MEIGIIGGGISGIVAALNLKNDNNKVTIIEKNNKCLKKLLITGNGRCNFWNSDQDSSKYYSLNRDLISELINQNTEEKAITFLCDLGLVSTIKNGYYYPFSNQAITLYNLLMNEIDKKNIEIKYNEEVLDIDKNLNVKTNNNNYKFDKLVLSTGSKAYPKTGSDGFGYKILKKLGHNIITPLPSLTGLKISKKYNWQGIRTDVNLKLVEDGKIIALENGEIQLTSYGISGICVFNLSGLAAIGLNNGYKEEVIINFIPFLETREMARKWFTDRTNATNRTVNELVSGILNEKLIPILLDENRKFTELSILKQDEILNNLINFKVEIIETNDFSEAQVCIGGVSLEEINLNTMESKIIPNLYIIGELLDLTGVCGGYNIGIALRSALRVSL